MTECWLVKTENKLFVCFAYKWVFLRRAGADCFTKCLDSLKKIFALYGTIRTRSTKFVRFRQKSRQI